MLNAYFQASEQRPELMRTTTFPLGDFLPESARIFLQRRFQEFAGLSIIAATVALGACLATWSINDPSLNHATEAPVRNILGADGAIAADLMMQLIGVSSIALLAPLGFFGWRVAVHQPARQPRLRLGHWLLGVISSSALASLLPNTERWPLPTGMGGVIGDAVLSLPRQYFSGVGISLTGILLAVAAIFSLSIAAGFGNFPLPKKRLNTGVGQTDCKKERSIDFSLARFTRIFAWRRARLGNPPVETPSIEPVSSADRWPLTPDPAA